MSDATLGASGAAPGLINALTDSEVDVRIGAARALAGMQYTNAASAFKSVVTGKEIRHADLTEKLAIFESYGVLGGAEAVDVLDRLLNKRGLLSRKEPAEIRASAARALGRIRMPKAQKALATAKNDSDAVVRTAVRRAIQGSEEAE
jgi:HEAT repeat protein